MPLTSINLSWEWHVCMYLCFCLMLNYLLIWKENNWSVEFKYFASMLLCIDFQLNFYDNILRKISSMVAKKTDSDVRYLLQTASCVGAQSMWCRHMMWLISASPNNPTPHRWYIIFYKEHITNLSFDDKPTFDLVDSERWKVSRHFHWLKQPSTISFYLINR